MREAAQLARVEELLPRWRDVPLYRAARGTDDFFRLPLIGKRELRENFPANFLRAGQDLDALLARQDGGIGTHLRQFGGADGGVVRRAAGGMSRRRGCCG